VSHDRGCPCGKERNEYDSCKEKNCYKRDNTMERTMIKQEPERYVWIRADGEAKIIDTDIVGLWQSPSFDNKKDRIYLLGEEVEIKVTVEVKNKTVYRENASGYRTPFENRD